MESSKRGSQFIQTQHEQNNHIPHENLRQRFDIFRYVTMPGSHHWSYTAGMFSQQKNDCCDNKTEPIKAWHLVGFNPNAQSF